MAKNALNELKFKQDMYFYGSTLDSHWIHTGSTLDPHWIHTGPTMDPHWIHAGSTLDPHCVHPELPFRGIF